jgi:hypothetical protein
MATQPFPPSVPTGLTKAIPSYLYQQYADDDDLQAFVASYNSIVQSYVDWFNNIGLPVYTGSSISGALLDWIANGLYGMTRPALASGKNKNIGALNTWMFNTIPLDEQKIIGPANVVATSDDVFKRILTWHFYKGDGKVFTVRWLKRRVMRFLIGVNGTGPPISSTNQISVSFGLAGQVNITFLAGIRTVTGGTLYNRWAFNTITLNTLRSTFSTFTPLANAATFKQAMDSGALEFPFQFNAVVHVAV